MTGGPWRFPYAGLPDEGATEPPYIWIEISGPSATAEYPCLVDSGSSFSAFPLEVASELGVPSGLLESTAVRTANGLKPALHLKRTDQLAARLDEDNAIPLAPYFFPPEVVEEERFESDYYILGRDFFLSFEISFRQAEELVVISRLV